MPEYKAGSRHAMMDDANGNGITLDGRPAMVAGLQLAFPLIIEKSDTARRAEISWSLLARSLTGNRNITSGDVR